MTRDQFLVEQAGGDTTQQYGCYSDYSYEAMPCVIDTEERRHNCVFASKGIEKTQCKNWVAVPVFPTDFSEWENMWRLLELAKKHSLVYEISNFSVEIIKFEGKTEERSYQKTVYEVLDIPNIAATLIAQALGFKEVKK